MSMIIVAVPSASGETVEVLAERLTAHLAIHPALLIGCDGATDYDDSALELTHISSGAMVCQIGDPLTVRPGVIREFARWLETVCLLDQLGHDVVHQRPSRMVREQIRRFADCPNCWRPPRCVEARSTVDIAR